MEYGILNMELDVKLNYTCQSNSYRTYKVKINNMMFQD